MIDVLTSAYACEPRRDHRRSSVSAFRRCSSGRVAPRAPSAARRVARSAPRPSRLHRHGVPVQTHVVEQRAVAELGHHIVEIGVAKRARQLREKRRHDDRFEELARLLGLRRRLRQPAVRDGEAGARRAARASARRRRSSRSSPSRRGARRRARARPRLGRSRARSRCCPGRRTARRTRRRRAARARIRANSSLVVEDPVKRRGRDDRIDRLLERQLAEVGADHRDAGRGRAARAPARPSTLTRRRRSRGRAATARAPSR